MMEGYIKEETQLQLDVKSIGSDTVIINLYTGLLCPEIRMKREDYEYLLAKGFFSLTGKDGKTDSAGIVATTEVYKIPSVTVTG